MLKKSVAKLKIREFPGIIYTCDQKLKPVDFTENLPIIMDIGSGSGAFITQLISYFDTLKRYYNYISVEIKEERLLNVLKRNQAIVSQGRLKLWQIDAINLDWRAFASRVSKIFLVCPDPWPKNRHLKHRLSHPRFLDKYSLALNKEGKIYFKTDNVKFFNWTVSQLEEYPAFKHRLLNGGQEFFWKNITGNYEARYLNEGKKIYYLEALKS